MRKVGMLGLGLVGVAVLLSGALVAQQGGGEEEHSVLAGHMQDVNKTVRALGAAVADPEGRATALEKIAELQSILLQAKLETPSKAADLEGDAKAEFMTGFRIQMIKLITATLELEEMILDEAPAEEVMAKLKGLQDVKQVGHRAYK